MADTSRVGKPAQSAPIPSDQFDDFVKNGTLSKGDAIRLAAILRQGVPEKSRRIAPPTTMPQKGMASYRTFFSHVHSRDIPGLIDQIKGLVARGDISPSDGLTLGNEMLLRLKKGRVTTDKQNWDNVRTLHLAMIDMTKQRPGMSKEQVNALREEAYRYMKSSLPETVGAVCSPESRTVVVQDTRFMKYYQAVQRFLDQVPSRSRVHRPEPDVPKGGTGVQLHRR